MSLTELRREFETEVVGRAIYAHVERLARNVARQYKPAVYAERPGPSGDWTEDLLEDLIQSFFSEMLIGQAQLQYALDMAHDLGSFDRILRAQLRRHLRHRRRRSVIDNLVDRVRQMLDEGEIAMPAAGDAGIGRGMQGDDGVRTVAGLVARIPRLPVRREQPVYGAQRAPMVFSHENLKVAVETMARALGRPVSLDEVRQVFAMGLTDLTATDLLPFEDVQMETATASKHSTDRLRGGSQPAGVEAALVHEASDAILERLGAEERVILLYKLAGESDGGVAKRLGISRPTAIKRKQSLFETLRDRLEGLPEEAQLEVIDRVYVRLLEDA